jgi:regulator of sigma E protease
MFIKGKCLFNLLPLPVLDGGHIFFLGVEKLRGRHLGQKTEEKISQIGIAFIITLAVFVFLNDLDRFGILEKMFAALGKIKW